MIRAYDEYGNVVRCVECKFYGRNLGMCNNERNRNRGSDGEYSFSIDYVGIEEPLLTTEECDNWFCADFEVKEAGE